MTMSKKIFASNCIFFISVLLCFALSIFLYSKLQNSDFHYVVSIGENWNQGPIFEIEKGNFLDCPEGKESIIDDLWDGTKQGCYCGGDSSTLFDNSCAIEESEGIFTRNCKYIPSLSPIPLKIWKGTNMCGKRGPSYVELNIVEAGEKCGKNWKSCGTVDSLNNKLCLPENIECPFNDVKFYKSNKLPAGLNKKYTSTISLGDKGKDGVIVFSKTLKEDSKIVTEFKIEDGIPCLDKRYKNLNFTPYKLDLYANNLSCNSYIGGENIDNNYKKIDSTSNERLYKENGLYNILMKLPLFDTYFKKFSNKRRSLYYKNYIGINPKCMKKLKENRTNERIINDLLNIDLTIQSTLIYCIAALFAGIFGVLLCFLFGMIYFCDRRSSSGLFFSIVSFCFFCFPYMLISSILFNKFFYIGHDFSILGNKNCTDPMTSMEVTKFNETFTLVKTMSAVFFSNSIIAALANSISLILTITYKSTRI